jgi:hypothetical protein
VDPGREGLSIGSKSDRADTSFVVVVVVHLLLLVTMHVWRYRQRIGISIVYSLKPNGAIMVAGCYKLSVCREGSTKTIVTAYSFFNLHPSVSRAVLSKTWDGLVGGSKNK